MTSNSRWTVEAMQRRLAKDPVAVERALITLFYQQTAHEASAGVTVEDNGVGFTGVDAGILTSFAQQILRNRGGYPDGRRLSPKQLALAQRKVRKYAGQLLRLAGLPVRRERKETVEAAERAMQRMEADGDRAESARDAGRQLAMDVEVELRNNQWTFSHPGR